MSSRFRLLPCCSPAPVGQRHSSGRLAAARTETIVHVRLTDPPILLPIMRLEGLIRVSPPSAAAACVRHGTGNTLAATPSQSPNGTPPPSPTARHRVGRRRSPGRPQAPQAARSGAGSKRSEEPGRGRARRETDAATVTDVQLLVRGTALLATHAIMASRRPIGPPSRRLTCRAALTNHFSS